MALLPLVKGREGFLLEPLHLEEGRDRPALEFLHLEEGWDGASVVAPSP